MNFIDLYAKKHKRSSIYRIDGKVKEIIHSPFPNYKEFIGVSPYDITDPISAYIISILLDAVKISGKPITYQYPMMWKNNFMRRNGRFLKKGREVIIIAKTIFPPIENNSIL